MKLTRAILLAGSCLLVGLSAVSAVFILERVTAAAWMWYKFHGFSDNGFISLSKETSKIFMTLTAIVIFLSIGLFRISRARSADIPAQLCRVSILVIFASALVYWILALSPLNQWRP